MKTLLLTAVVLIGFTVSAQNNYPTTAASGAVTGTENITGTISARIAPVARPNTTQATTATASTLGSDSSVITAYGRNNDGSSTGTTVTGNSSRSEAAPVEDNSPSPANKGGTLIVTPRRK